MRASSSYGLGLLSSIILVSLLSGCIKSYATASLADALADSGQTFASDDDPALIAASSPFALKTMESLLEVQPEHRGLLLALSKGFTQYAYAFVHLELERVSEDSVEQAIVLRHRARKLYRRAQKYAYLALELEYPGFERDFRHAPESTLSSARVDDVPILYWLAAATGLLVSVSKDEPQVIAELAGVGAIGRRLLQLNETWESGTLHELMMSYETNASDGDLQRAKTHYKRALELAAGQKVGPFVGYAEGICIKEQNQEEFTAALRAALAVDLNKAPQFRLANTLFQDKARWLLSRTEDLFVQEPPQNRNHLASSFQRMKQ